MTIRFKEPDVLFDAGRSDIQPAFQEILNNFFPRYIRVLQREQYIDHINEIRIEGHTSIEGRSGMSEDESYFYNMELSQDRTRSVLATCLYSLDRNVFNWTKNRATANGLSSVKPIESNATQYGRQQNRRVEFKVKTDAEAQIREMLRYARN